MVRTYDLIRMGGEDYSWVYIMVAQTSSQAILIQRPTEEQGCVSAALLRIGS